VETLGKHGKKTSFLEEIEELDRNIEGRKNLNFFIDKTA